MQGLEWCTTHMKMRKSWWCTEKKKNRRKEGSLLKECFSDVLNSSVFDDIFYLCQLWGLISCVNLTRLWGVQTFGQTLFIVMMRWWWWWWWWWCQWGCLWMRLTLIGRLSKVACPSQCGWVLSNQLKAWIEGKSEPPAQEETSAWLPLSWDISFFLCFQTLKASTLLGLQCANWSSWGLSAFIIMWAFSL